MDRVYKHKIYINEVIDHAVQQRIYHIKELYVLLKR